MGVAAGACAHPWWLGPRAQGLALAALVHILVSPFVEASGGPCDHHMSCLLPPGVLALFSPAGCGLTLASLDVKRDLSQREQDSHGKHQRGQGACLPVWPHLHALGSPSVGPVSPSPQCLKTG